MVPSPRKLAHLADLNAAKTSHSRRLHLSMGALRQARLAIRQAQGTLPDDARLSGQKAAARLDDLAELLHLYTHELRKQADDDA